MGIKKVLIIIIKTDHPLATRPTVQRAKRITSEQTRAH